MRVPRPALWLRNGHVQTLFARLMRRVPEPAYRRERITTPDDDFLDLDWAECGSSRLAVISHGLEGSSQSIYVRGMVNALMARGWDCLAWNFRGCGGEMNRTARLYHSGSSDDLRVVVRRALENGRHRQLAVVGFSLGGNVTLKFLGEEGAAADPRIRCGAGVSVPCDLSTSSRVLARPINRIYMRHFLRSLNSKALTKARRFPGSFNIDRLAHNRTFHEFDDQVTAPLHGFADAEDYYAKCGSAGFLRSIAVPTLLLNALDDPFLSPKCYPRAAAEANAALTLETPRYGGHVGFLLQPRDPRTQAEIRVGEFLDAATKADFGEG